MFVVTYIFCEEDLIKDAGFSDRVAARKYHYLRAKTLYDVDHETDRDLLAASLHLLGFWWNGPDDQKDAWFWLGCATSYAQSLGLHRSIRDEDCDIEPPIEADLYYDDITDDPLIPPQNEHQTAFFLEMRKAAEILGDIVIGEFSPRRIASERYEVANLRRRLEEWELQLPKSQVEGDIMARRAADTITRMTEDLIAVGTLRYVQMHIIPAVFGALSIHTLVICRKDPIRRQLAGNKSRQCILALSELAKSWPIGLWITKFFVNLFRRLTGQGSAVSAGSIVDVTSRIARANEDNSSGEAGSQNLAEALNGFSQQPSSFFNSGDGLGMEQQPGDMLYPDQFGFDSFWAEDTIDVDLLLQHGLCPLLPTSFGPAPPGSLGL
ncbi:hypothetical protein NW766_004505 [Fusarium irregulare]|uniref:Xylanolytic transcriptional activator regulatory domain-containing protein n=1 Tax=Fusarium irregulare TaxID=2494466 RepID=A0A9W8UBG9_9HYPO|nr:hypothetical protein NW766_004505 [Fusarium irregulare]